MNTIPYHFMKNVMETPTPFSDEQMLCGRIWQTKSLCLYARRFFACLRESIIGSVGSIVLWGLSVAMFLLTVRVSACAQAASATNDPWGDSTKTQGPQSDSLKRRLSVGLNASYNLYQNVANFLAFPGDEGYPAGTPNFTGTLQGGLGVGAVVEVPFSELFTLSLRAGVNFQLNPNDPVLQALETTRIGTLDPTTFTPVFQDVQMGRVVRANLLNPTLEAHATFYPFEQGALQNLRLFGGVRAGLYLNPTYTQLEQLIVPAGTANAERINFNNGSKERNKFENRAIPSFQNLNLGIVGGVAYDIYTMKRDQSGFIITPEVSYTLGVTPVSNTVAWNQHTIRAGVSLRFVVEPTPLPPPPPPPPPVPQIRAKVTAFGIDTNGVESPLVKIRVEEYVSRQLYPMLGFIFFDAGSAALPQKYKRYNPNPETIDEEFGNFQNRFYNSDMMSVYYDILNIVANRMTTEDKYKNTKITLVGCNDNTAGELNNLALSQARAQTVRDYLVNIWGIDSNRIAIKARNLPERPTNSVDSAGLQENRRVEIVPSDPTLLDPLLVFDTISVCSIQKIRFQLNARADAGYKETSLRVTQGSKVKASYRGAPPKDNDSYMWNILESPANLPKADEDLTYTYEVTDQRDSTVDDENSIPIEYVSVRKKRANKTKDRIVDTFRLISFGFNSTEVGDQNSKIIKDYINPYLTTNSRISTIGYTDRLGNPDVNQRLSDGRAKSVSAALKTGQITSLGVGARKPLYDNETPEGRFYNRTVEVRVETTVE